MAEKTNIEWCDSTVNPTSGCDGCELWRPALRLCYAGGLHEGRLAKSLPALYAPEFGEVRLIKGRMAKAAAWPSLRGVPREGKRWLNDRPRMIFIGDLGDTFSGGVPFEYLRDEVIAPVSSKGGSRHVWLWLTKRPRVMAEFARWLASQGVSWPSNLWAGTSVTTQATAAARIPALLEVPAPVRFLSCEPLLGPLDLTPWLGTFAVDWVIVGYASGAEAPAGHPAWAADVQRQCEATTIPFFFKQHGEWQPREHGEEVRHVSAIDGAWGLSPEQVLVDGVAVARSDTTAMSRVGKHLSGRALHGRSYTGMPAVAGVAAALPVAS